MKISEIMRQPHQMPIQSFEGKIQKVYDVEKKVWEGKEFTTQNLVLSDDTGVIYAQLSGMEPIPKDAIGQAIFLECYSSKQHGLTGMKMNKYKKKDGSEGMNLKLSKSVIMQVGMPEKLPASEIEFDPDNKATPDNPSKV